MRQGSPIRDERRGRRTAVRCSLFAVRHPLSAVRRSPFAVRCSLFAGRSPAFTLIELMVVIGIVVVIAAIALPAMGPMLRSNQNAQMLNTLNTLLVTAKASAEANASPVAIRIERAFETGRGKYVDPSNGRQTYDPCTYMVKDASGEARWLDHQQARFFVFAKTRNRVFTPLKDSRTVALPKGTWLAPGYALSPNSTTFDATSLADSHLRYTPPTVVPPDPNGYTRTPYNRLENFFLVFDNTGRLTEFPAANLTFEDPMQPRVEQSASDNLDYPHGLHVRTPDPSTTSLIAYEREQFNAIPSGDGDQRLEFLNRARPVFINRTTGSLVEEQPR